MKLRPEERLFTSTEKYTMPYLREPNWSIFSNASIVLFTVATPSSPNWLPMNDVIFLALITFRNYDQRINLVLESL